MTADLRARLWLYAALNYPLILLVLIPHLRAVPASNGYGLAFGVAAYLVYGALYGLAPWAVARMMLAVAGRLLPQRVAEIFIMGLGVALYSAACILLFIDGQLYAIYGFHFNGFVWNLITTPGGIASMGMSMTTVYSAIAFMVLVVLVQSGLATLVARVLHERWATFGSRRRIARLAAVFIALALMEQSAFGMAFMHQYAPVLVSARVFPLYQPTTFRSLAKKLGYDVPRKPRLNVASNDMQLNYPAAPLDAQTPARPLNIVWLVSESWRWDMLDASIMPRTYAFAQQALNFRHHYSGGNGTRMGLMSMFYGLYGNYWFPMLARQRGPVLIDVLQRQGYRIDAFTSASFSYPEFNKTIFAQLPADALHEDSNGETWQRDRRNVDALLQRIGQRDRGKPFMTFMFFESPHARYQFPSDAVIRTPYLEDFNYATVDLKRDIGLIKNRYINACHHLDSQFARVLDYLEREKLLDSTVVILTGDHGEEFMEKGRWGHNSDFVEEQVRVPLVLHVPGAPPAVVDRMTSHLDIPATLMPLLGVRNPSGDYSLGYDLRDGAQPRAYTVMASWTDLAYRDDAYKASFPRESGNLFDVAVRTAQDAPVADEGRFFEQRRAQMAQLMRDSARFMRPPIRTVGVAAAQASAFAAGGAQ